MEVNWNKKGLGLIENLEEDLLSYFQCIFPEQYEFYGIDEEDVSFGAIPALKHPTFLPSPSGGNAYGLGLLEQSLLKEEEIKFLSSLNLDKEETLSKHFHEINELYRKMGLLIRISRFGKPYYLIPYSFLSHSILDVRIRVRIIHNLWPEISESISKKIGIMTSPKDILYHELVAHFPQHSFHLLHSYEEIKLGKHKFDAIICPHTITEYLKITDLKQFIPYKGLREKKFRKYLTHFYLAIYKALSKDGVFIKVCNSYLSKTSGCQNLSFKDKNCEKLFIAFCKFYRYKQYITQTRDGLISISNRDLQTFIRLAPFVNSAIQKILKKSFQEIDFREIESLKGNYYRRGLTFEEPISKIRKSMEYFFSFIKTEELIPEEYEKTWRGKIEIKALPPLFFAMVAKPKQPKVTVGAIEKFLKRSQIAGYPVELVSEYRNSLFYLIEVINYLESIIKKDYPYLKTLDLTKTNRRLSGLLKVSKKLENISQIINPFPTRNIHVPFFENIPTLSLLGLKTKEIEELSLIVTGYSPMSRIFFGKYPVSALTPIKAIVNKRLDTIDYITAITIAEVSASLGRPLREQEILRILKLRKILLDIEESPPFHDERAHSYVDSAIRRIMLMVRTEERPHPTRTNESILERLAFKNQELLRLFAEARFHGTGHTLCHLGFYPALMLLWASLQIISCSSYRDRPIIINFNPLIKGVPKEHRIEKLDKLRRTIENLLNWDSSSFEVELGKLCSFNFSGKNWFWETVGLNFELDQQRNILSVIFVDLDESAKTFEEFFTYMNSRSINNIPENVLISVNETFEQVSKVFKKRRNFYNILEKKIFTSIFRKLMSLEEAPETLAVLVHYCEQMINAFFCFLDFKNLPSIIEALKRLKAITHKDRASLKELDTFYTMAKKEFGPFSEERISPSRLQFQQLEKMLYNVHSKSQIYQSLILAIIFQHLSDNYLEKNLEILVKKAIKAKIESKKKLKSLKENTLAIIKARKMIKKIYSGQVPMISIERMINRSMETILEAAFLATVVLEENYLTFMTSDALEELFSIRSHIVSAIKDEKAWKDYIRDCIREKGKLFLTEHPKSPVQEDIKKYGEIALERDPLLLVGRYITALDRLLKIFLGIPWIGFGDVISLWKGALPLHIYQSKSIRSLSLKAFEKYLENSSHILNKVFQLPEDKRFNLLLCLDELGLSKELTYNSISSYFLDF